MRNLTDCPEFQQLADLRQDWPAPLTPATIRDQVARHCLLHFSYAGYLLSPEIRHALQALAESQGVIAAYHAILDGQAMNTSENRVVSHHQTRGPNRGFYGKEQARADHFADGVRSGELHGAFSRPFTTVVQVGIGGSELGPKALVEGLHCWALTQSTLILETHFLANIDPNDFARIWAQIDPETTLFITVSKSGTTLETALNLGLITQAMTDLGWTAAQSRQHLVSVTMPQTALDDPTSFRDRFYIDASIGGRYSGTSVVGTLLLSLVYGPVVTAEVLAGAAALDENARLPDCTHNLSLMAALLGIWECNVLGCTARAIIPYSQSLAAFPAHLQQLDCESNGKSVNRDGQSIDYATSPVVFGEPGTNSQHSFFQKLHQGPELVPIHCIGFAKPYAKSTAPGAAHDALLASLVAQLVAFSTGQAHSDPNKTFSGHRPCSLVIAPELTPQTLGALLAFYENKIMFEGFLWNLNSFDQEGVQLGKTLAQDAASRSGPHWPLLEAYLGIIGS